MTTSTDPADTIPSRPCYRISVKALVEHVLRHGDLRSDLFGAARALDGIRTHQWIQSGRPDGYEPEVPVAYEHVTPHWILSISGRIDGIQASASPVRVEEIKTSARRLDDLADDGDPVHWGQVRCYAYMLALQRDLDQVQVQLTYVHIDSRKTRELSKTYTFDQLEHFFMDLLARYSQWVDMLTQWRRMRNASIDTLAFPFQQYRPGQRQMAVQVFRSIRDEQHGIIQAATGIGKTLAAVYPAVKAMGQGLISKVVFLTARTTGRHAAQSALARLGQGGLRIKTVTLTAKDKICFCPDSECNPEDCEFSRGFYDRLNDALMAAWGHDVMDRAVIEDIARQHRLCPFEFSLALVPWVDAVVGDYNYVFDPFVYLKRLLDETAGKMVFLVDEAHNLVDRSRQMFSADLTKAPLLAMRRELKKQQPAIYKALGRLNAWMAAARRRCEEDGGVVVESRLSEPLVERVRQFLSQTEKWLRRNIQSDFRSALVSLFFEAARFFRMAEQFDERYAVILTAQGRDLCVRLFCIDPSAQLAQTWQRCRSAILFSATLTPASYFIQALGCPAGTIRMALPSPFPSDRLMVLVCNTISTLYRQRQASSLAVAHHLAGLAAQRSGHYLFFFPSYAYMAMIRDQLDLHFPQIPHISQRADMDEADRDDFLSAFERQDGETLVGLAVMGGVFGEGIDLAGSRLIGAAIVGVGLPGICPERELIRDYFDKTASMGFDFAYRYPGINRVLQAAGRVIRSETDSGIVMLVDQRYATPAYRQLLPTHWRPKMVRTHAELQKRVTRFWQFQTHQTRGADTDNQVGLART